MHVVNLYHLGVFADDDLLRRPGSRRQNHHLGVFAEADLPRRPCSRRQNPIKPVRSDVTFETESRMDHDNHKWMLPSVSSKPTQRICNNSPFGEYRDSSCETLM